MFKAQSLKSRSRTPSSMMAILWLIVLLLRLSKAEEQSLMNEAQVPTQAWYRSSKGEEFLHGSFKTAIQTNTRTNPIDLQIDLNRQKAEVFVTFFILAASFESKNAGLIGSSQIVLLNEGAESVVKTDIFDTGFYQIDSTKPATSFMIRRISGGDGGRLSLANVRAYQTQNLLQYGATIYHQTTPVVGNEAENLIENLESRSSGGSYNAKTNSVWQGPRADYKSCYVTNSDAISADGNKMKVVIDLKNSYFQHAILLVDDLRTSYSWKQLDDQDKRSFMQNLQIYIGDDPDNYENNKLCAGGPFLDINDEKNYLQDSHGGNTQNERPWSYGIETWCNLEGRYTHLIADLDHQAGQSFTQTICNLGIFGSLYGRQNSLPEEIEYVQSSYDQIQTLDVEHVQSELPIGNEIEIQLRQKSSLQFISMEHYALYTTLTINLAGVEPGEYQLVIESYDALSSQQNQNVLKTDTITLRVIEEELEPIVPSEEKEPTVEILEIVKNEKIEATEDTKARPVFEEEMSHQVLEMGKLSSWVLPNIVQGAYSLAKIDFIPDQQVASLLRFDPTSLTVTFDGQKIDQGSSLVGKIFFVQIRLFNQEKKSQLFIQTFEILQLLCSTNSAEPEKFCESQSVLSNQVKDLESQSPAVTSQKETRIKFDMTNFYIEPITCSSKDAQWSMSLPPLLNPDDLDVKIQMQTKSSLFTFDQERSIVFINKETRKKLLSGQFCPLKKQEFFELTVTTQNVNILTQEIAVSIQQAKDNALQLAEETEKLIVEQVSINSLGELKLKFNRPILNLPLNTLEDKYDLRRLEKTDFIIEDIISVKVKDAEEFDEDEKYIKSMTYLKAEGEASKEITLAIVFNDYKAITSDVYEPDQLIVEFLIPQLIIDAETYELLEQDRLELDPVDIVPQMTKQEQETLVKMKKAAAVVGVGLSIWIIILCFAINKSISKMWILFNSTQFLVYIGMWQINYSSSIKTLFKETKRVYLGEYLDDLEIGQRISTAFGIQTSKKFDDPEENLGEDRLGSDQMSANFGITLILGVFVFLLVIGIVSIAILVIRRKELSQENEARIEKYKQLVFYNPIIRFLFLSALKLNHSSMVILKKESSSFGQIFIASLILISIALAIPSILSRLLYKKKLELHQEKQVKTFGTMYLGRRVYSAISEHSVWIYPIIFFFRRTIFIIATVFLFKQPNMQMLVHQLLTMANLIYISIDQRMFVDKYQKYIEIASELLLLLTSVFLQQFMLYHTSNDVSGYLEISIFTSLALLVLLNTIFLVYGVVLNYRESKRTKAIKEAKSEYEKAIVAINEKRLQIRLNQMSKVVQIENGRKTDIPSQKSALQAVQESDNEQSSRSGNLSSVRKVPVPNQELLDVKVQDRIIAVKTIDATPDRNRVSPLEDVKQSKDKDFNQYSDKHKAQIGLADPDFKKANRLTKFTVETSQGHRDQVDDLEQIAQIQEEPYSFRQLAMQQLADLEQQNAKQETPAFVPYARQRPSPLSNIHGQVAINNSEMEKGETSFQQQKPPVASLEYHVQPRED